MLYLQNSRQLDTAGFDHEVILYGFPLLGDDLQLLPLLL